jgi:hypothetical protein
MQAFAGLLTDNTDLAPRNSLMPKDSTGDDALAPHEGRAFIFYIENDTRKIGGPGSDQAYSNGFKYSYIFAEDKIPRWSQSPFPEFQKLDPDFEKSKFNYGISFAQQIYTPNNTHTTEYIRDDRPYAAWLYFGFAFSFHSDEVGNFFELDLGTVGPSALGKEVQNDFHDLIGDEHALGWKNGLHDEPTVQTFYQQRYRALDWQNLDFYTYYGGALGNVQIGAHAGAMIRVGENLPNDFGPSRPSASDGDSFVSPTMQRRNTTSLYSFVGARGNAIARNIFLDGNTYQKSPHVTKYPFTFETEFGFGTQVHQWAFIWRFVTRSPEFQERSRFNSFASINITYLFAE